ncbi:recombinase family protein [Leeuwenhoekiella sp. NPDC079379]|uniref:recombinase family protein n=1 Tax=Leeuwenhoekiella sp. NPDC079379 TaxID=3364122 RepID=UPI0037C5F49F
MKLGIYARKSTDKQKSTEFQIALGVQYAKANKLEYQIYSDEGLSGTGDYKNRPEFEQLLSDIVSGDITHVHIWNQNRAEREPLTFFTLAKIVVDNNTVLIENGVVIDLNDEDTFFLRGIQSMLNRMEVKKRNSMIKGKLKYNAQQNKVHGKPPLGFTKDENNKIIIDKKKAPLIQRIYDLAIKGEIGAKQIARLLTDEGIPTTRNKDQWKAGTILDILKNPWFKGERNFSGTIYKVPAIISSKQWDAVQQQLTKNRRYSKKITKHNYLLTDILVCKKCGKNYQGKRNANYKYAYYMCASRKDPYHCGNKGVKMEWIEENIWDHFFRDDILLNKVSKLINQTDTSKQIKVLQNDLETLNAGVEEQNNKRKKAVKLVLDNILSDEDVKQELLSIENRKTELFNSIKNTEQQITFLQSKTDKKKNEITSIKNLIDTTPFNKQKQIVKNQIDKIEIEHLGDYIEITIHYKIYPLDPERLYTDKGYKNTYVVNYDNDEAAKSNGYINLIEFNKEQQTKENTLDIQLGENNRILSINGEKVDIDITIGDIIGRADIQKILKQ